MQTLQILKFFYLYDSQVEQRTPPSQGECDTGHVDRLSEELPNGKFHMFRI
jgi:hypothetical protein